MTTLTEEQQKLLDEARKEIDATTTKEARKLAKMKWYGIIYGATKTLFEMLAEREKAK